MCLSISSHIDNFHNKQDNKNHWSQCTVSVSNDFFQMTDLKNASEKTDSVETSVQEGKGERLEEDNKDLRHAKDLILSLEVLLNVTKGDESNSLL